MAAPESRLFSFCSALRPASEVRLSRAMRAEMAPSALSAAGGRAAPDSCLARRFSAGVLAGAQRARQAPALWGRQRQSA